MRHIIQAPLCEYGPVTLEVSGRFCGRAHRNYARRVRGNLIRQFGKYAILLSELRVGRVREKKMCTLIYLLKVTNQQMYILSLIKNMKILYMVRLIPVLCTNL